MKNFKVWIKAAGIRAAKIMQDRSSIIAGFQFPPWTESGSWNRRAGRHSVYTYIGGHRTARN